MTSWIMGNITNKLYNNQIRIILRTGHDSAAWGLKKTEKHH